MRAPMALYNDIVKQEWIDYNGHMSEAYYVLTFGFATEAFLTHLGAGESYRTRTGNTHYTAEAHINYLKEVKEGTPLKFFTHLLNFDAKRLHLFHTMAVGSENMVVATTESMQLHVDQRPRVISMPKDMIEQVQEIYRCHKRLPVSPHVGRIIGIVD